MVPNNNFEAEGLRRLLAPVHTQKPSRMQRILNRLRNRSANPKKDRKETPLKDKPAAEQLSQLANALGS